MIAHPVLRCLSICIISLQEAACNNILTDHLNAYEHREYIVVIPITIPILTISHDSINPLVPHICISESGKHWFR